jgi:hypothetical protein
MANGKRPPGGGLFIKGQKGGLSESGFISTSGIGK